MVAANAGRSTRNWKKLRKQILAESDICVWCGHPGARVVNHNIPRGMDITQAENPDNLAPIHGSGVYGCPHCPPRWSRRARRMMPRDCNNEVGRRPLHVARAQRPQHQGSRLW